MKRLLAVVVLLIGFGPSALPARAGFLITIEQVGSNVVVTGSGSIDLTGLTPTTSTSGAGITPDFADLVVGPRSSVEYSAVSGPASLGPGTTFFGPSSSSGPDNFGVIGGVREIFLPTGYSSGAMLSDTDTYDNKSLTPPGRTPTPGAPADPTIRSRCRSAPPPNPPG
jgi:hypothetical protein